jgi:hypothetical protein
VRMIKLTEQREITPQRKTSANCGAVTIVPRLAMIFGWLGAETIMIKNGLYALAAIPRQGSGDEVSGVLILNDGTMLGGDAFVYYTGTYECSAGNWQGKMTSQEHTPTGRPIADRVQHIGFFGTYSEAGARSMQWLSLASTASDTMQRCACW